jgi:hypothetical protein
MVHKIRRTLARLSDRQEFVGESSKRPSAVRPTLGVLIVVAFWLAADGHGWTVAEGAPGSEKVTTCALRADPATYDHKLIDVRGVVSHGLENFTLSDSRCDHGSRIWLEYGGRVDSDTVYCCGVRTPRTAALVVEGLTTTLIDDALFRRFDAQVRTRGEVRFRAHLIGRFFAGVKQNTPKGEFWGGYGHFGCCSLLVIQQIVSVEASAGQ